MKTEMKHPPSKADGETMNPHFEITRTKEGFWLHVDGWEYLEPMSKDVLISILESWTEGHS